MLDAACDRHFERFVDFYRKILIIRQTVKQLKGDIRALIGWKIEGVDEDFTGGIHMQSFHCEVFPE